MKKQIRRHIIFFGRVQGVGFRYRAYYAAVQLKLSGWVCNLDDGTVEMEVQGTEEGIDALLVHMSRQDLIRIDDMEIKEIPLKTGRNKFRVLN